MALNLKLGDRVLLKKTSQYNKGTDANLAKGYNPLNIEGTINFRVSSSYGVEWDNGISNGGYDDSDLELVSNKSDFSVKKEIISKRRLLLG